MSVALAAAGEDVLLVDDDPLSRAAVAARLERAGAHVEQAAGVAEAIDAVERRHVDVVLCDCSAPRGTGVNLRSYLTRRGFRGRFVLFSRRAA
jgi:CheY-like chemotaxis protein